MIAEPPKKREGADVIDIGALFHVVIDVQGAGDELRQSTCRNVIAGIREPDFGVGFFSANLEVPTANIDVLNFNVEVLNFNIGFLYINVDIWKSNIGYFSFGGEVLDFNVEVLYINVDI